MVLTAVEHVVWDNVIGQDLLECLCSKGREQKELELIGKPGERLISRSKESHSR